MWYIINEHEELWDNWWGWTDNEDCFSLFSDEEKAKFNLPIGGKWVKFDD